MLCGSGVGGGVTASGDTLIVDGRVWEVRPLVRWDTVTAGRPSDIREARMWSCGVQGGWGRSWTGSRDGAQSLERWLPGMPASGYGAAQWEWSPPGGMTRRGGLRMVAAHIEWQQWGQPASPRELSDSVVGFVRVPGVGLQQVTRIRYPIGVETDTLAVNWMRQGEVRWRLEAGGLRPLAYGLSWSLAGGVSGVIQPQSRWWLKEPEGEGAPWQVVDGPGGLAISGGLGLQWRRVDLRRGQRGVREGWGASATFHAATDGTWWLGVGALYRWPLKQNR